MEYLNAECADCHGTGLYSGFAEPPGVAVVCIRCNGTGCQKISYKPFVKRYGKTGVKTVRRSGGAFIATGVGPVGGAVTYQEFQSGKMPT